MSKRQITIKPTCLREILAFPSDRVALLWEKINHLVTDPLPDGNLKKKIKGSEGIYRLRVGDHRVFYRFGEEWLCLLGIRRRNEDTYGNLPVAELSDLPPNTDDEDLDAILEDSSPHIFTFTPIGKEKPLPFKITRSWLNKLGVPTSAHPILTRCKSEDELLEANIPNEILARVLDAIFPPSLKQVSQQPDLLVPSTEHLIRYKEGDLLGFLLHLDEDQIKFTQWALNGPTMVSGGAGTGKSTVAIYRVKEVLERPGATGQERLLFTTYTRALLTVTRQLLEQLLSPAQMARVRVATCDQIAREIVSSNRNVGQIESDHDALQRLRELRKKHQPSAPSAFESKLRARALSRLSDQYLLEEFDWIITGRGLESLDKYIEAPRPGRGVAFPARLRAVTWDLYKAFCGSHTGERFPEIRNEALNIIRNQGWTGHWDYVFVDEAQDLSPSSLALMAEVCSKAEGLFFAADTKQSIYSRNYTWTSAHPRLQFRGRTASLKRNYRSTKEIERAAFSVLQPEENELIEPSISIHEGPLPVLVRNVEIDKEAEWIARFVRQMSRHLHLRENAAVVLVPTSEIGQELATALSDVGMPAVFSSGRDLDLKSASLKILTMFSAKGLEFPMVVVCGFREGTYSIPENFDDLDLFSERTRHERRLLYVALTRAMRGLMLLIPKGCQHPALTHLDTTYWHVEEGK
jgi:superfamily I DNA/RNA helicase/mRNA-degrading endonuclease RelE of RelBE toxin-antitoxin system